MQPVMFNSNAPHAAVTPTVTAQPTAESATDAKPSVTQPADTAASNRSAAPQKEATLMEQQAQLKESAEKFNKSMKELVGALLDKRG